MWPGSSRPLSPLNVSPGRAGTPTLFAAAPQCSVLCSARGRHPWVTQVGKLGEASPGRRKETREIDFALRSMGPFPTQESLGPHRKVTGRGILLQWDCLVNPRLGQAASCAPELFCCSQRSPRMKVPRSPPTVLVTGARGKFSESDSCFLCHFYPPFPLLLNNIRTRQAVRDI